VEEGFGGVVVVVCEKCLLIEVVCSELLTFFLENSQCGKLWPSEYRQRQGDKGRHGHSSRDILICFQQHSITTMEGLFYNVHAGYLEGIVRGYRNSLLTSQAYSNLAQCETIDGKREQRQSPHPASKASL